MSRPPHDSSSAGKSRKKSSSRRKKRGGGGRKGGASHGHGKSELTSVPTSRNAFNETKRWLLAEHGPVCAYCARKFTARVMTLDHVAPRRGQTAYDRRDNLVLACPGCNMIKKDMSPLAFLLGSRVRAVNLARYGTHLSPMLIDMARSLIPAELAEDEDPLWAGIDLSGPSPYRDS